MRPSRRQEVRCPALRGRRRPQRRSSRPRHGICGYGLPNSSSYFVSWPDVVIDPHPHLRQFVGSDYQLNA